MCWKLTAAGDLSRALGQQELLDEVDDADECVGQRIAVRLRRWLGEWSFDTRLGMDWETLLQKGVTDGKLRAAISREVTKVPGVRAIREITVTRSGRTVGVVGRVVRVGSDVPIVFGANVEV